MKKYKRFTKRVIDYIFNQTDSDYIETELLYKWLLEYGLVEKEKHSIKINMEDKK